MRTYKVDRGDGCIFGSWLLHGGPPNMSYVSRWIYFFTYFPLKSRPHTESPIDSMKIFEAKKLNVQKLIDFGEEASKLKLAETGSIIRPSRMDEPYVSIGLPPYQRGRRRIILKLRSVGEASTSSSSSTSSGIIIDICVLYIISQSVYLIFIKNHYVHM